MTVKESDIGHFTRHTIPMVKALVKKRWFEGNPICVETPFEDSRPWLDVLMSPEMLEEFKKHDKCV